MEEEEEAANNRNKTPERISEDLFLKNTEETMLAAKELIVKLNKTSNSEEEPEAIVWKIHGDEEFVTNCEAFANIKANKNPSLRKISITTN